MTQVYPLWEQAGASVLPGDTASAHISKDAEFAPFSFFFPQVRPVAADPSTKVGVWQCPAKHHPVPHVSWGSESALP